jgi:hypothetical protein
MSPEAPAIPSEEPAERGAGRGGKWRGMAWHGILRTKVSKAACPPAGKITHLIIIIIHLLAVRPATKKSMLRRV